MTKIQLFDTTLRDGMQGEGMSLSAREKVRVAHRLDELGIDVIEAGFAESNPKELELFSLLAAERFQHALDEAGVRYCMETYPAAHGWMKPDFPVYDAAAAKRGWHEMLAFFGRVLR